MKRKSLALFVVALAMLCSGTWLAIHSFQGEFGPRSTAVATTGSTSGSSELPATEPAPSQAIPIHASVAPASTPFWPAPAQTKGRKIDPESASYLLAASRGEKLSGRIAPLTQISRPSSFKEGDRIAFPLFDGESVEGVVHLVQLETETGGTWVSGTISSSDQGTFAIFENKKLRRGQILLPDKNIAIQIVENDPGKPFLEEKPLSEVICYPLPLSPDSAQVANPENAPPPSPEQAVPILSSRPSAVGVLFIDFDGATVTDPLWNGGRTIVAPPHSLSDSEITDIWNRVKEDFLPFNVDVTTSQSRYNNAPVGRRMRCIVTSNDIAAKGSGGVAYLHSFRGPASGFAFSSTIPCWVFNSEVDGIAEAISHEFGHTLGLNHDGRTSPREVYYRGHGTGSTSWGPIMGASYNRVMTQWSRGEYAGASSRQDDLAIISGTDNQIGHANDDVGDSTGTAVNLNSPGGSFSKSGTIERSNDVDFYRVGSGVGTLQVSAQPIEDHPNLDIALSVLDSSGAVVASNNPAGNVNAGLMATITTAGTYYIVVRGSGNGSPLTDGYSTYGSLGFYQLSGVVPPPIQPPVLNSPLSADGIQGILFSYDIAATNSPTSYNLTGTLPPGLALNPTSGRISGTPTMLGVFDLTATVSNSVGTDSEPLQITISAPTLATAVDASLAFSTTGTPSWFPQTTYSYDGIDAAQSGDIADGQQTTFSSSITGPARIRFQWSVDSESTFDFLQFFVNGVKIDQITGVQDWVEVNHDVPEGTHQLAWTYVKDAAGSSGLDAGWVDQLRVISPEPPEITSSALAEGTQLFPFEYTIVALGEPTSFSIGGTLPPGLSLDSTTGVISGLPLQSGVTNLLIRATNEFGTDEQSLQIDIFGSLSLGDACDLPSFSWSTFGDAQWEGQRIVSLDSTDAGQTGQIDSNGSTSASVSINGPGRLEFSWNVDSESGYDYLGFSLDGTERDQISGQPGWGRRVFPIPVGAHRATWTYRKDGSIDHGQDAGWLDRVRFVPAPANDFFENAIRLSGKSPTGYGTSEESTSQFEEPLHAKHQPTHSVWWKWKAPQTGKLTVTTAGSSFDTLLGFYYGRSLSKLGRLAGDNDSGPGATSQVTVKVLKGATYYIAVDGANGAVGNIRLKLKLKKK